MERPAINQQAFALEQLRGDYGAAVLHAAWGEFGAPASGPALVFAWIELLPHEIPPPPKEKPRRFALGPTAWVETGHHQCAVDEALCWYEKCRTDHIVKFPVGGQDVHLLELGDEPPWPRFVLETKSAPFLPTWCHSARTHHLIAVEGGVERLWPDAEARRAAIEHVGELMHFNFDEFPEYLGSVHLVATNPVFREIGQRLRVREDGHEDVLIRIDWRSGPAPQPLQFVVHEERVLGSMPHFIDTGTDGEVSVEFPGGVEALGMVVRDQTRGALYSQPAYAFLRSLSMTMEVNSGSRTVQGSKDSYTVPNSASEGQRIVTGTPHAAPVPTILRQADALRKARYARATDEQFWIDDRQAATSLVRGLIFQARQGVFVVDPYFSHDDLFDFVLAVRSGVPVTILSSPLGLQVSPGTFEFDATKARGRELKRALDNLPSQGIRIPIEVRIMPGRRKPRIHDRFLFADDNGWSLGGSLNHLGERASVVSKLAVPEDVRRYLEDVWKQSKTLAEWLNTPVEDDEDDP